MKCKTNFCRRSATRGQFCSTCSSRNYRKKNPIRCSFLNLRANSKRRGIEFTLTLDQFNDFCFASDYISGKGKKSESFSIDWIDPLRGYIADNIQVLTLADNVRKHRTKKILIYDYQFPEMTTVIRPKVQNFISSPSDPF